MNRKNAVATLLIICIASASMVYIAASTPDAEEGNVKTFNSIQEVKNHVEIKSAPTTYYRTPTLGGAPVAAEPKETGGTAGSTGSTDYSETNIQEKGVDEPDTMKNDGEYIYTITDQKVKIAKAYPVNQMKTVSTINLEDYDPQNLFINDDKLVVFTQSSQVKCMALKCPSPTWNTDILIYDLSDIENPERTNKIDIPKGNYEDARMINNTVYTVVNQPIREEEVTPPVIYEGDQREEIDIKEVKYFDNPDTSYQYSIILSTDLEEGKTEKEVFLTGSTEKMYVSQNNIYLAHRKRITLEKRMEKEIEQVYSKELPSYIVQDIKEIKNSDNETYEKRYGITKTIDEYTEELNESKAQKLREDLRKKRMNITQEKSVINRISIGDKLEVEAQGEVKGTILNQFSMDEHGDYFRVATTTGHASRTGGEATSGNNLYTLTLEDLELEGEIEDIAPGEEIYSARFMGDRAYLVTFRKVDPFYVIDLENQENPEILGSLKIPGYSDYLHPYDEDHIIGIGKETIAAEEGNFSWYQGVKIAMFDVTDVSNPKEVAKYEIGDRGTESPVLDNHRALLFDKEKNLMVMPVKVAEVDESDYAGEPPLNAHGETVYQGAHVFNVTSDEIKLRGKITHLPSNGTLEKSGYHYFSSPYKIERSLYIEDNLYTVSENLIKANDLNTLEYLNEVKLSEEQEEDESGKVKPAKKALNIEGCSPEDNEVLVRNTGSTKIDKAASVYNESDSEVGYIAFNNTAVEVESVKHVGFVNTTSSGALSSGETYTMVESNLPTVQFTC